MAEEFDLDKHTFRLLQQEPFFAALSRRIHKQASEAIPTAGVCLNKHTAQFEMLYNKEFMASLPDSHKLGVLMHEFYHIIYGHVTGRLPSEGMNKQWNIATDLAINSHIADKLPEVACVPGRGPFKDYPSGKAAEWYYKKLKEDEENQEGPYEPQDGDGDGDPDGDGSGQGGPDSLDSHEGWGEASDEVKEMAKERMKQAIQDATKEVQSRGQGWGSVSSSMRQKIMDMITPRVDWRKVLRTSSRPASVPASVPPSVVSTSGSPIPIPGKG